MAEATTNLTDVAADRITIWNNEERSQQDIREIFVNNEQVKRATRFEQQVGDETDIVLVYEAPSNSEVPSLKDIVDYIAQEKLGADATVNKFYSINRRNVALIQQDDVTVAKRGRLGPKGMRGPRGGAGKAQIVVHEAEMLARRGRTGATGAVGSDGGLGPPGATGLQGPEGLRGLDGGTGGLGQTGVAGETGPTGPTGPTGLTGPEGGAGGPGGRGPMGQRGAAGKAQIVIQEGDVFTTTKSAPSIRGRQEMVLSQGDTHLSRITKHREVNQCVVNHTDTQLLNVTKRSSSKRNDVLLLQEGDRTTIRNSTVNRRSTTMIEVSNPITAYRKPKQVVARSVIVDVFSPVFLQRITNITKVNRNIFIFSPGY
jgi:hypothetical protein